MSEITQDDDNQRFIFISQIHSILYSLFEQEISSNSKMIQDQGGNHQYILKKNFNVFTRNVNDLLQNIVQTVGDEVLSMQDHNNNDKMLYLSKSQVNGYLDQNKMFPSKKIINNPYKKQKRDKMNQSLTQIQVIINDKKKSQDEQYFQNLQKLQNLQYKQEEEDQKILQLSCMIDKSSVTSNMYQKILGGKGITMSEFSYKLNKSHQFTREKRDIDKPIKYQTLVGPGQYNTDNALNLIYTNRQASTFSKSKRVSHFQKTKYQTNTAALRYPIKSFVSPSC